MLASGDRVGYIADELRWLYNHQKHPKKMRRSILHTMFAGCSEVQMGSDFTTDYRGSVMRADKYDPKYIYKYSPRNTYDNFRDWLQLHPTWIIGLVFAYMYYLATTEEV